MRGANWRTCWSLIRRRLPPRKNSRARSRRLNRYEQNPGRILDKIHSELVVAQTRESLLSQAVSAQAGLVSDDASKAVHYNILKREVDTNREVWESLLQRVKEAGISAAMRSSNSAWWTRLCLRPYRSSPACDTG